MWRACGHVSRPYRLWPFFHALLFLEVVKPVFDCFCWFSSSLDRKGQSHQVEYCSESVEECSKSKIHKSEPNQGTEVLILSTSLIRAGEIFVSVAGSLFTINEQAITNACLYLSFLLRIMLVKRYFHKLAFTLKHYKLIWEYSARNLKADVNISVLLSLWLRSEWVSEWRKLAPSRNIVCTNRCKC